MKKTGKTGKTGKTPYKKAKEKAWKAFSRFIRTRDSIKTTNSLEACVCVTCGNTVEFSKTHAGHAIDSRCMSILFDEHLVNGQGVGCNIYGNGKYAEYSVWFINEYGLEEWEEKVALKHTIKKYKVPELEEIEQEYKDKLKEILEEWERKEKR